MRWAKRLGHELLRVQRAADGERAVGELVVSRCRAAPLIASLTGASEVALVTRGQGEALGGAKPSAPVRVERGGASVVELAPGIYASIPGRKARIELLRALRAMAPRVVLHVPVSDEKSHIGRLAIDVPRRLLRAAKLPAPEPGDRFGPGPFRHCYFDEEPLYREIADAGATIEARRGFTFVLGRSAALPIEPADPFVLELARAASTVKVAEHARTKAPPAAALAAMRARGRLANERGPVGRARLRRAISWLDAGMGASCYRRVLLELALDAGAARERVVFGLDVGSTGHAAFEGREDRTFDVVFALGPEDG